MEVLTHPDPGPLCPGKAGLGSGMNQNLRVQNPRKMKETAGDDNLSTPGKALFIFSADCYIFGNIKRKA